MTFSEMNKWNFKVSVDTMNASIEDADTEDVVKALRVLSEFLTYNDLGGDVDMGNVILASKAIDVAYTALAYPACTEYDLNLSDCIEELRKELKYHY